MDDRSRNLQLNGAKRRRTPRAARRASTQAVFLRHSGAARWLRLWRHWRAPANGETLKTFTIITGEPNALCAPIHNRMPVIIDAADWQTWLGEVPASSDELQTLLQP